MSIYDFLERLDADPFDPALTALFLDGGAKPARHRQKEDPPQDVPTTADGQPFSPLA